MLWWSVSEARSARRSCARSRSSRPSWPPVCSWLSPSCFSSSPLSSLHLSSKLVANAKRELPRVALFLLQLALRIEVADAARLAACRGIDHRIDQGRLAGIHRGVDRALELIRVGRIHADPA